MKKLITISLLILALTAQTQVRYSSAKQIWNVRSNSTAGVAPTLASFTGYTIVCWNQTDSVAYFKVGTTVVPKYAFYAYSVTKKDVYPKTITSTATFGAPKYLYYIKTSSVAGNIPPSTDNTAPNLLFWNTADNIIYRFVANVITPIYRIHAFSDIDLNQYFIATNGNDTTGTGTRSKPWRSLYKATSTVITAGNIINVAAGTYLENKKCSVAVGVSIKGDGKTNTVIICKYNSGATNYGVLPASLDLQSATAGTNGNQYIAHLTLNGSGLTAIRAITVKNRGNVEIYDCIIKDFYAGGISFYSQNGANNGMGYDAIPTVYETGNKIYNCTIDNCGDQDATLDGGGLIMIACQQNMLIHDNLLYSNKRVGVHNGNIINAGGRHFKNVKYYNNKSYKPDPVGYEGWNFHLEIWNSDGGFEIYNNEFWGGDVAIDCAGHDSQLSEYEYCYSIHDNLFRQNDESLTLYAGTPIELEGYYIVKTLIYNNTFRKGWNAIALWGWNMRDIYIYSNTFYKVRNAIWARYVSQGGIPVGDLSLKNLWIYNNSMYCAPYGYTLEGNIQLNASNGWDIHDVFIYNNTAVGDNLVNTYAIKLSTTAGNKIGNVDIANNINCYFNRTSTFSIQNLGLIDTLKIRNNFSFNTSNRNTIPTFTGNVVTNYTYTGNIPTSNTTQTSPLFVSESTQNYNLKIGSPAINAGVNVGIPYLGTAPDMGAFEKE